MPERCKIEIKNIDVLRGFMAGKFHTKLYDVIDYINLYFDMVITESMRPARHQYDVHATDPVRAVDLRAWIYSDGGVRLAKMVNNMFIYDPDRPAKKVAVLHKVKGGAMHLHIQVHPNTVLRG